MKADDYDRTVALMAAVYDAGFIARGEPGTPYGDQETSILRATGIAAACGLTRDEDKPAVRGVPVEVVERLIECGACGRFDMFADHHERHDSQWSRYRDAADAARAAIAAAKEGK